MQEYKPELSKPSNIPSIIEPKFLNSTNLTGNTNEYRIDVEQYKKNAEQLKQSATKRESHLKPIAKLTRDEAKTFNDVNTNGYRNGEGKDWNISIAKALANKLNFEHPEIDKQSKNGIKIINMAFSEVTNGKQFSFFTTFKDDNNNDIIILWEQDPNPNHLKAFLPVVALSLNKGKFEALQHSVEYSEDNAYITIWNPKLPNSQTISQIKTAKDAVTGKDPVFKEKDILTFKITTKSPDQSEVNQEQKKDFNNRFTENPKERSVGIIARGANLAKTLRPRTSSEGDWRKDLKAIQIDLTPYFNKIDGANGEVLQKLSKIRQAENDLKKAGGNPAAIESASKAVNDSIAEVNLAMNEMGVAIIHDKENFASLEATINNFEEKQRKYNEEEKNFQTAQNEYNVAEKSYQSIKKNYNPNTDNYDERVRMNNAESDFNEAKVKFEAEKLKLETPKQEKEQAKQDFHIGHCNRDFLGRNACEVENKMNHALNALSTLKVNLDGLKSVGGVESEVKAAQRVADSIYEEIKKASNVKKNVYYTELLLLRIKRDEEIDKWDKEECGTDNYQVAFARAKQALNEFETAYKMAFPKQDELKTNSDAIISNIKELSKNEKKIKSLQQKIDDAKAELKVAEEVKIQAQNNIKDHTKESELFNSFIENQLMYAVFAHYTKMTDGKKPYGITQYSLDSKIMGGFVVWEKDPKFDDVVIPVASFQLFIYPYMDIEAHVDKRYLVADDKVARERIIKMHQDGEFGLKQSYHFASEVVAGNVIKVSNDGDFVLIEGEERDGKVVITEENLNDAFVVWGGFKNYELNEYEKKSIETRFELNNKTHAQVSNINPLDNAVSTKSKILATRLKTLSPLSSDPEIEQEIVDTFFRLSGRKFFGFLKLEGDVMIGFEQDPKNANATVPSVALKFNRETGGFKPVENLNFAGYPVIEPDENYCGQDKICIRNKPENKILSVINGSRNQDGSLFISKSDLSSHASSLKKSDSNRSRRERRDLEAIMKHNPVSIPTLVQHNPVAITAKSNQSLELEGDDFLIAPEPSVEAIKDWIDSGIINSLSHNAAIAGLAACTATILLLLGVVARRQNRRNPNLLSTEDTAMDKILIFANSIKPTDFQIPDDLIKERMQKLMEVRSRTEDLKAFKESKLNTTIYEQYYKEAKAILQFEELHKTIFFFHDNHACIKSIPVAEISEITSNKKLSNIQKIESLKSTIEERMPDRLSDIIHEVHNQPKATTSTQAPSMLSWLGEIFSDFGTTMRYAGAGGPNDRLLNSRGRPNNVEATDVEAQNNTPQSRR